MNRERRAQLGQETLEILERGDYVSPSGARVSLQPALDAAISGSQFHPFRSRVPEPAGSGRRTQIRVANETTLAAAWRLSGARVCALNFASAKNPGGGFLSGAQAQEESIARASGLYACVKDSPFYALHRGQGDAFYTHSAIHSPDVPVFRGEDGGLLEEPWSCSLITCPAVNRGALIQQRSRQLDDVPEVMRQRIERILSIAAHHGHESLVLGAFGCGVFRNEATVVAELFRGALSGRFAGVFARVHFAVLDRPGGPTIEAFERVFAQS